MSKPVGGKLLDPVYVEQQRAKNKLSRMRRYRFLKENPDVETESPSRGINDPAEIARRVAIVRKAKHDHMVMHGEFHLPSKVLRSLDLDGGRA